MSEKSATAPYIDSLRKAIRRQFGCRSNHLEGTPTETVVDGKTIWKSVVEMFLLINCPLAKVCYAWGYATRSTGEEVRIVTVLGVPPVDSPRKAVQLSIDSDSKPKEPALRLPLYVPPALRQANVKESSGSI
jgi:hypothetical protein